MRRTSEPLAEKKNAAQSNKSCLVDCIKTSALNTDFFLQVIQSLAGPELVLFCYIPACSGFPRCPGSFAFTRREEIKTFADRTNCILTQWCICLSESYRWQFEASDIISRHAVLRVSSNTRCPHRRWLNNKIGRGLFTTAAVGLSDSAVRVLLGDRQIKDSWADRRRLRSPPFSPESCFTRAAMSGWTLISSRCRSASHHPPHPSLHLQLRKNNFSDRTF